MLNKFLKYLRVERNYSVQTIRAYGDDLRQFFSYCGIEPESDKTLDINHRMVRAWLSYLLETNISARSVNRKLSSLRSFYRFQMKNNLIQKDPLAKVVPPKLSKKLPVFLKPSEANMLLDEVPYPEGFLGIRDLLIMELFYFTGVRVSELAGLTISNVDLDSQTIKVMGKGAKERIIPMHSELRPLISEYLLQRSKHFPANNSTYLIVSNKGEKSYPQFLYRIVNKYLSMVTALDKKSPHVLRHTFATHLLNQGADINAIKELLGHASLSATQVYTHTSVEKLKSAYKLAHPRA